MINRMDCKGTLRLLVAMRRQAERDIKCYTANVRNTRGSDYVGKRTYESALNYLNVELPAIKEVISDSFKEL